MHDWFIKATEPRQIKLTSWDTKTVKRLPFGELTLRACPRAIFALQTYKNIWLLSISKYIVDDLNISNSNWNKGIILKLYLQSLSSKFNNLICIKTKLFNRNYQNFRNDFFQFLKFFIRPSIFRYFSWKFMISESISVLKSL